MKNKRFTEFKKIDDQAVAGTVGEQSEEEKEDWIDDVSSDNSAKQEEIELIKNAANFSISSTNIEQIAQLYPLVTRQNHMNLKYSLEKKTYEYIRTFYEIRDDLKISSNQITSLIQDLPISRREFEYFYVFMATLIFWEKRLDKIKHQAYT